MLPSGSPFFAHFREHETAFAGLPHYAHEALFRAYIASAEHYPLRDDAADTCLASWRGETGQPAFYRQIAHSGAQYIEEVHARYRPLDCRVGSFS